MNWEEVKAWLEANKASNTDVAAFYQALSTPTVDGVKTFVDTTAEGKAWFQRERDTYFNKGLETWKGNNLSALVDAEVKLRNPDKSPEMLEIEKLKAELAKKDESEKRSGLLTKAQTIAAEKGLPLKLVERFLGEDEEKTLANLGEFETELAAAVQSKVDEKFKGNGYQPGKSGLDNNGGGLDISKLVSENQIRQN